MYTYDVYDRRIGNAVDTTMPFDMANAKVERFVYDTGRDLLFAFLDPDGSGAAPMALTNRYLNGAHVDQVLADEVIDGEEERVRGT